MPSNTGIDQPQPTVSFVSVIIPCFNDREVLDRCLQSLLAQDYPPERYEIIVVDNNSTDHSPDIVRRFERVNLLHESKQSAYASRNRGVREAKGDIIAFTDSDCVIPRDWIARIDRAMREPRVHLVLGHVQPSGKTHAMHLLRAYERQKDSYVFNAPASEKFYGHAGNMAVRRNVFSILGPFAERERGVDSIFVQRVVRRFGRNSLRYEPQLLAEHLEMQSATRYFDKMYVYGRSRALGNSLLKIKPLSIADRLRVFRRTVQNERLDLLETILLLALLTIGAACWRAGSFSAKTKQMFPGTQHENT